MADMKLTFEYKPSLRGQTILTAKLGEKSIHTDKLDISRAKQRKEFVAAMLKGRRGLAKYRKAAVAELDRIAAAMASPPPAQTEKDESGRPEQGFVPYVRARDGLYRIKKSESGDSVIQLTNFDARIVADVARDDGAETQNSLEIEARIGDRTERFTVPASSFPGMNWAIERLGSKAIVSAGATVKDHARTAIQMLSDKQDRVVVYTHMGWRKIGDQWVYLHAGGAIGQNGAIANVRVELGDGLSLYRLPDPPQGQKLKDSAVATIRRLDLAPDHISVPSVIVPFRAAIGQCDFTPHVSGTTGVFKSELAALMNQHFGPGLDSRHLPGSWHGTENALEGLAFTAKDAVLVIDDFAPTGPPHDVQRWHQKADRIIRHQGNNNSRQRMRPDSSLRPPKPPRGMIVSTGEDVPRGHSLRARMFIIEVNEGDIDVQKLTACQADAANGLYATAMAGYVQWLASRYGQIHETLRAEITALRQKATASGMHRRTPDIVASLAVGLKYFLAFAKDVGAITLAEETTLWERGWLALGQVAAKQAAFHQASEPTRRFIELLLSAIASGRAHLAAPDGRAPNESPEAWGWRQTVIGNGMNARNEWLSQGDRIGWVDGDTTYLDPEASYRAAQMMVAGGADGLGIPAQTLRKRMHERNLLVMDKSRETLTVRRVLEGRTRDVLQLIAGVLTPEPPDKSDIPDIGQAAQGQECRECQVASGVDPQEQQHEIDERAAIMEVDGNLPPQQAQAEARRFAQGQ